MNYLLFMLTHKLYMLLLILFIKFFVIQISYHVTWYLTLHGKSREDFYLGGFNFTTF